MRTIASDIITNDQVEIEISEVLGFIFSTINNPYGEYLVRAKDDKDYYITIAQFLRHEMGVESDVEDILRARVEING